MIFSKVSMKFKTQEVLRMLLWHVKLSDTKMSETSENKHESWNDIILCHQDGWIGSWHTTGVT